MICGMLSDGIPNAEKRLEQAYLVLHTPPALQKSIGGTLLANIKLYFSFFTCSHIQLPILISPFSNSRGRDEFQSRFFWYSMTIAYKRSLSIKRDISIQAGRIKCSASFSASTGQ